MSIAASAPVAINGRLDAWTMIKQLGATSAPDNFGLRWNRDTTVVLSVDSEKGGVGKTSLSTGIAAVAGHAGLRVLVIDLDPRATATAELGVDDPEYTVNDLMYVDPDDQSPVDIRGLAVEAICPAGESWPENVHVLPGDRLLGNRESDNTPGMEQRLMLSLEGVLPNYDLVVIDLPPRAGGKIVAAAIMASTHLIYPGTLDEDALIGVRDAQKSVTTMRAINPDIVNVGVVRNIVASPRTAIASLWDQTYREELGEFLVDTVIPQVTVRQQCRTARVPVTAAASKSGREPVDVLIRAYAEVLNAVAEAH